MNDFQEIYSKYYPLVFAFLLSFTGNRHDLAEELTQETLYQVFLSSSRFQGKCALKTWIFQIAKNVTFKYYEKNPIHQPIYEVINTCLEPSTEQAVEQEFIQKEASNNLQSAILNLPEKYRDVILYRVYGELSYEQIAQVMDININSAKVLFHRGKKMLKNLL